jgi:N-acyl-D-aspartate/D-glutamate deacylase
MGATLFRNATILDGSGAAPFRGDALVDGNRIVEVAPAGRGAARLDAHAIDWPIPRRSTRFRSRSTCC